MASFGGVLAADVYTDALATSGEKAGFWLLLGLLGSYLFIRTSARLMRSPKVPWWPGSVKTGDLHVHHLVFGICIVMVTGFLSFVLQPETPWLEVLAAMFGIGAGLTLDEFALWLYLKDVYWQEEGRRSFEAVAVAVVFALIILIGAVPLDPGSGTPVAAIAVSLLITIALAVINVFKGKLLMAIFGLFIPLVVLIGAIRLARPGSRWARWRYKNPKKMERARKRAARVSVRRRRWSDRIAGAPSIEESSST